RVLVLGDSITASTSSRYTNDMCKALVPLGWQVEVEAEVSRGIDFGNTVLAKRMSAGWDLGVVFLGTNNGGTDGNEYLKQLNKIITTFAPSPVVLVTVGQFRPEMKGINDTIRAIAGVYPDRVRIVDWNHLTEVYPTILSDDGIHPTVAGRQVLAQAIASELGQAPTSPGDCLPSVFTDDSAGSVDGKSGSGNTGTTVRPRSTQSTVPKETPTTVKGGGSNTTTTVKPVTVTTTVGGGGSGTTLAPTGPTTPPATYGTVGTTAAPQQTAPPAPPTTAAPGP
ncbi:MAG: hypothetical protein JWN99_472, partial [Ilumatobacteraceae bacterium]|nr:hypothetical protein [Ilumatobacteraceae bacterium]